MDEGNRLISLKRGDVCCRCGSDLPSGFRAVWNFYARTTTCLDCAGREKVIEEYAQALDEF